MHGIRGVALLLAAFSSAVPLWPQEQTPRSKLLSNLSAQVAGATDEPRDSAQRELFADYLQYEAPYIATSLADPLSFIAFVTVSRVEPPEAGNFPYTRVTLHVDQLLRGASQQTELTAESRWAPPRHEDDQFPITDGALRGTAFDYTEPRVGNRFLVGYPFIDVDRGFAHIFGAIDLNNHGQAVLIPDVQRFLSIESAAGLSDFAPFVKALNDSVPWIRDLSAQRLVQSDACNNSSACELELLNSARRLSQSKKLGERWEALQWMQPIAPPVGECKTGADGVPTISDSSMRELLASALTDANLWIEDEAFRQIELFDSFHDAQPDECIVIFPSLRKFVRLPARELEGVTSTGILACASAQANSD
jgi:hypothetical protein